MNTAISQCDNPDVGPESMSIWKTLLQISSQGVK